VIGHATKLSNNGRRVLNASKGNQELSEGKMVTVWLEISTYSKHSINIS
jgi:hypothetical protein